MPPYVTSETARERELYKYYQPNQVLYYGIGRDPQPLRHTEVPQLSADTVLTAFAQLACLRLNTKRAMISFVDQHFEYIAAEATRTLSLQSDSTHDISDGMLAGNRTIPKSEGLCSTAVYQFTERIKEHAKITTTRLVPKMLDLCIVPDLAADERFKMVSFSARSARLAFYAGAPITSSNGFVIGVISVIDEEPRDGLCMAEQAFLFDLSKSVMEHLEVARVTQKQYRAEGMVKGIGMFVEGKASLRDWWLLAGHESRGKHGKDGLRRGLTLAQQADEEYGTNRACAEISSSPHSNRQSLVAGSLDSAAHNEPVQSYTRPLPPAESETWESTSSAASWKALSSGLPHAVQTSIATSVEGLESTRASQIHEEFDASQSPHPQLYNKHTIAERMRATHVGKEIEGIFSRASNLIREATAVKGVLFLDVGFGNYEGSTSSSDVRQKAPGSFNGEPEHRTSDSIDEDFLKAALLKSMNQSAEATASKNQRKGADTFAGDLAPQKCCGILGWSTRSASSLYKHKVAKEHSSVPEKFLQRLLRCYPHGQVFNFDEAGSVSSSEEDIAQDTDLLTDPDIPINLKKRKQTKQLRRKIEADMIISIFPGARSVAFMPLWDPHREKWFSGGFSWSLVPTRVFDVEEDLTYLAAFGNSIMAEVSRMNALIADQRKSDLISVISHELRSPLHGVLASTEILKETNMDALQDSMVAAIYTCSRSLLDVINHVLEYSMGNNANQAKTVSGKRAKTPNPTYNPQSPSGSLSEPTEYVNLTVLTEEVVESILAGHRYDLHHAADGDNKGAGGANEAKSGISNALSAHATSDPVMVILDFEWQHNWIAKVPPGAWKHIVMNLVINAIKYTDAGFVCVSLRCSDIPVTKLHGPQSQIVLSVTDSGKGISDGFLRDKLFQPFSQEDDLNSGVGLGLHIIHRIIKKLGGTIKLTSELGTGTEAVVTVLLDKPEVVDTVTLSSREQSIADVQLKVRHIKACLVGFDVFPDMSEVPTGILSIEAERMISLKSSLTRLLVDWFGIDVIFDLSPAHSLADIYITTEAVFRTWPSQLQDLGNIIPGSARGSPLIVVGCVSASLAGSISNSEQSIVFIQEPCGPYKLAKALSFCLNLNGKSTLSEQGILAVEHAEQRSAKVLDPISLIVPGKVDDSTNVQNLLLQQELSQKGKITMLEAPVRQTSYNWSTAASNAMSPFSPSDLTSPGYIPIQSVDRPHILIVEDNEINMKILVTVMRRLSHSYDTAENGLKALEAYKSATRRFDVILMDISMPIMDGLTSTRRIRAYERETSMTPAKIIALTAAVSADSRQEALESGVNIFLTKPVPLKQLKGLISSWRLVTPPTPSI